MTRALVRRACGHLQAVCVFGNSDRWIDRAIWKKERDICDICRNRQKKSVSGEESGDAPVVSPEDSEQHPAKEKK
jgi:hypothetical protein